MSGLIPRKPTVTQTVGFYSGSYLVVTIAQVSPLKPHDGDWEATAEIWDRPTLHQTVYKDVVAEKFQELANRWSKDTLYMSSITDMVAHPSYLAIIALGERVVPLLLRELERAPNYWFSALMAVTGENPIPEEARGRLTEMTEAWLEWGRDKHYF